MIKKIKIYLKLIPQFIMGVIFIILFQRNLIKTKKKEPIFSFDERDYLVEVNENEKHNRN